ncbi:carboxymuconolactone decarboxylase family protein [Maribacter polysiphoniae]|uniref:AhpD family alkylhydroperoxidase n=1 Tax=Maribacter polysiphoniae TaxID=429344 RepID=A0A316E394_9FLAO|nr:carboxymuconolactone decarboxylase family protein [Maribacter polysiphoniae]MBD1258972.1 carboxymuconolactone decarboxylase family protein [Maribacter polysiphoniae]PWK24525.1 AhpD family alkylhydroperoxidase [Maribacter polysiphoniae]
MNKNLSLTESVIQREEFKRRFSLREMYLAVVFTPRAISKLIGNKKSKLVDKNFVKRIQLAVTEVNGCAICSYGHAKMALRQGMGNDEINSFLSGGSDFTKPEEAKAIMFAQYFADSRGFPKKYAYDSIVKEYGKKKARIILSAAQMMITGNMYGIPFSAFLSRLHGKPYKDSTLIYELGMLIAGILCLPIAIIHGFLRGCIGLPNERFDKSMTDQ